MNCEICELLRDPSETEELLRVVEGISWIVSLRRDQEYLGTCFITARRHVESLPALTRQEEDEFISLRNALITAQQNAFGAQVVNVSCLMNLAFDTDGKGTPHVHYHLKPRYAQEVSFAGETFQDRQFGRYIKDKYPHEVSDSVAMKIVAALKSAMSQK